MSALGKDCSSFLTSICSLNDQTEVECYWETQPGGCTRKPCPFKHKTKSEKDSNKGLDNTANQATFSAMLPTSFEPITKNPQFRLTARNEDGHVNSTKGTNFKMAAAISAELTCPICLEMFEDPVTLACMHSYCRHCLESILKSSGGKILRCPECRLETAITNVDLQKMPRNFTLANIVAKYETEDKVPKIPCDLCDEKPPIHAVKSCKECKISYCGQCLFLHPKKGVLATHSLVEPQKFETETEKKPLEIFCMKCVLVLKYDDNKEYCQHDHPAEIMDIETAKTKIMNDMLEAYVRLDDRNKKYVKETHSAEANLKTLKVNEEKTKAAIKEEMKRKYDAASLQATSKFQEHMDELDSVFKKETKAVEDEFDAWSWETWDRNGQYLQRLKEASSRMTDIMDEMQTIFAAQSSGKEVDIEDLMKTYLGVKAAEESRGPGVNLYKSFNLTGRLEKVKMPLSVGLDGKLQEKSKTNAGKVQNVMCTPNMRKKEECASITVTWYGSATAGDIFEIKFIDVSTKDHRSILTVSGIRSTMYTENRLQHDTKYDVTVSYQNDPSSESGCRRISTLPGVFCEAFQFSSVKKSRRFHLQWDNKHAEVGGNKANLMTEGGLRKLGGGAIGTLPLRDTLQYWEVKVSFHFRGVEQEEYVVAIGICPFGKVDAIDSLACNFFFYGIAFAKSDKGRMFISMKSAGVEKKIDYLQPQRNYSKRIGFLFNPRQLNLTIIEFDSNTEKILYTTDTLKTGGYLQQHCIMEYHPVCDLNDVGDAKIELLTGSDIKNIPMSIKEALVM